MVRCRERPFSETYSRGSGLVFSEMVMDRNHDFSSFAASSSAASMIGDEGVDSTEKARKNPTTLRMSSCAPVLTSRVVPIWRLLGLIRLLGRLAWRQLGLDLRAPLWLMVCKFDG